MLLNGQTSLSNFNPTNLDASIIEIQLAFLKRLIRLVLHIFVCTLISKHIELLQQLDFFGLRSIADIKNLLNSKSRGTANDITNVISFADVVKEEVCLGCL